MFCTVTVSPKLTRKLTKRAVFKSELICDILLRSSINKDRSERFVLTVISLSRMRKEIDTSRIFHDQASKKSVSRLIQISKVKSYHHPRSNSRAKQPFPRKNPHGRRFYRVLQILEVDRKSYNRLTLWTQKSEKPWELRIFNAKKCELIKACGNRH